MIRDYIKEYIKKYFSYQKNKYATHTKYSKILYRELSNKI